MSKEMNPSSEDFEENEFEDDFDDELDDFDKD